MHLDLEEGFIKITRSGLSAPTDRVGKVFFVVNRETRRCLICEERFSRKASRLHSNVVCYPQRTILIRPTGIKEHMNA